MEFAKNLVIGTKKSGGRSTQTGRTKFFHRGGGYKRRYRFVDYFRSFRNTLALVRRIEFDPNRTSMLALVCYPNEFLSYIIAPVGLKVGDIITVCEDHDKVPLPRDGFYLTTGSVSDLQYFPVNSVVHSLEITTLKGRGAQFMRAAGCAAQILRHSGAYTVCRLKSGECRQVPRVALASLGMPFMSLNFFRFSRNKRKAGFSRRLGKRPIVRGCAMNPVDHPHGGNTSSKFGSFTPWGKVSKGVRTARSKLVNKNIVQFRVRNSDRK